MQSKDFSLQEINQNFANALLKNSLSGCQKWLSQGADINIHFRDLGRLSCNNLKDQWSWPANYDTPLTYATEKSNYELVELLLGYQLNIDLSSNDYTPLMIAAFHQKTKLVRLLLRYGANPNIALESFQGTMLTAMACIFLSIIPHQSLPMSEETCKTIALLLSTYGASQTWEQIKDALKGAHPSIIKFAQATMLSIEKGAIAYAQGALEGLFLKTRLNSLNLGGYIGSFLTLKDKKKLAYVHRESFFRARLKKHAALTQERFNHTTHDMQIELNPLKYPIYPLWIQTTAKNIGLPEALVYRYWTTEREQYKKIDFCYPYLSNFNQGKQPALSLNEVLKGTDQEALNLHTAYIFIKDGYCGIEEVKKFTEEQRQFLIPQPFSPTGRQKIWENFQKHAPEAIQLTLPATSEHRCTLK